MKLGVLLPTFRQGADDAFGFAREAVDAGLDGVFAYDHLWPMGSPERPALAPFPLLAAVARRHQDLTVAPLVARVGLVSSTHLVEQFRSLASWAAGRVIATLGTGDRLSADENLAYGLSFQDADERRELLYRAASVLREEMPVWIGAGAQATNELARSLGVTLNLWDAPLEKVREQCEIGPTSWAGPAPSNLFATLDSLRDAGVSWAVLSPQVDIAQLKEWRESR